MTESQLLELFRQALRVSLAFPLVASGAACGGGSTATSDGGASDGAKRADAEGHDAARRDATHDSATARDAASDHGSSSAPDSGEDTGARVDSGKRDAESHEAGATNDAGETKDAVARDSARSDAGGTHPHDAGIDCGYAVTHCYAAVPAACVAITLSPDASGYLPTSDCEMVCPSSFDQPSCFLGNLHDGGLVAAFFDGGRRTFACENNSCGNGRGYEGMELAAVRGQTSPLGRYLAETAQLEGAAVDAFRILRDELLAHGAPDELVRAAEEARADEVRHARTTRSLAGRFGPTPPQPRARRRPVRPLEAIAVENAVEGCVRETYGALLAHHQASAAEDARIRRAMGVIAVDETRHAALGWAVAAWAESRLDDEGRARVRAARRAAVRAVRGGATREVPPSLVREAGLPDATSAARMLAVLEVKLWS